MIRRFPWLPATAAGALLLLAGNALASHTPTSNMSEANQVARIVQHPVPARNLYDLTDQLVLHPPRPIARVVRTTSPNYPVGHQDRFAILSTDNNHYFYTRATIRVETPHLYIYVQNGAIVDRSLLQQVAARFERSIYPLDRSVYGSEWRPGVDGDPHITCLVANLRSGDTIGAYSAEDEYPKLVDPYSNQREIIYVDAGAISTASSFEDLLSHEFQHMIHWHMHAHDNAWLNEGMSVLAEHLNHFEPSDYVSSFSSQPDTDLLSWSLDSRVEAHYGAAYLFLAYLYDHFGRSLIHTMVDKTNTTDLQQVHDALKILHIPITANELFRRWVVANGINDSAVDGGIYYYSELPRPVDTQLEKAAPFVYHGTVLPYAAQYLSVRSTTKPLRIQFSGPTTGPLLSAKVSAPFWWSDNGDMSDMRLIRSVDLRHAAHPVLHYDIWYSTEDDYDYGYVEASRDGGRTWTTLPATHTTRANPTGSSYGDGYTGSSEGWKAEQVDLSAYAGQQIELRFEYVTDDEYNLQGIALRNIAIPAIGWRDDFSGWLQQGFVRVPINLVPENWEVQVISRSNTGTRVTHLPLHDGKGALMVTPSGSTKVSIVVYSQAPKTLVPATYTVNVQTG